MTGLLIEYWFDQMLLASWGDYPYAYASQFYKDLDGNCARCGEIHGERRNLYHTQNDIVLRVEKLCRRCWRQILGLPL